MSTLIMSVFLLQIVGADFTYIVQSGDSLTSISARFGVDLRVITEANGLQSDRLAPGQALRIDNRHIVPQSHDASILVNVPQRMLFYFSPDALVEAFPIAAGRAGWRTPLGDFKVVRMEENPTWDVPISIQNEMRRNGKPVLTHVPPSPQNPLGQFWIGLNIDSLGIHGTDAPASIYHLVTHGCIRVHPDDIRNLYSKVRVGTTGRIIYQPMLLARIDDDIFLEVHPDPYSIDGNALTRALDEARDRGFIEELDLQLLNEVIRKRDGIARNVTRQH